MEQSGKPYDLVGMFRADTMFTGPIDITFPKASPRLGVVPNFDRCGGTNDRMFYGDYESAKVWANRFGHVEKYLEEEENREVGLYSEKFLRHLLGTQLGFKSNTSVTGNSGIIEQLPICLLRVRADDTVLDDCVYTIYPTWLSTGKVPCGTVGFDNIDFLEHYDVQGVLLSQTIKIKVELKTYVEIAEAPAPGATARRGVMLELFHQNQADDSWRRVAEPKHGSNMLHTLFSPDIPLFGTDTNLNNGFQWNLGYPELEMVIAQDEIIEDFWEQEKQNFRLDYKISDVGDEEGCCVVQKWSHHFTI